MLLGVLLVDYVASCWLLAIDVICACSWLFGALWLCVYHYLFVFAAVGLLVVWRLVLAVWLWVLVGFVLIVVGLDSINSVVVAIKTLISLF